MAEPAIGAGPGGVPARQTLRHWPWLVMCLAGFVIFGVLSALAGYTLTRVSSVTGYVVAGGFTLGLGTLTVYTLASLRTRTVLEPAGLTVVAAFSRTVLPWSRVIRLDVSHSLPGWAVRAWSPADEVAVVFLCHDTHGRRPQLARTFEHPPIEAPTSLRRGFTQIERYWQASIGPARARSAQ